MAKCGLETSRLELNSDFEFISVRRFSEEMRRRLGGRPTDFVLAHRTARVGSIRIDNRGARFLRLFAKPTTLLGAIIAYSRVQRTPPEVLLEEVYALVTTMLANDVLVVDGLPRNPILGSAPKVDEVFEGYRLIARVTESADTCVYQATTPAGKRVAIKYIRKNAEPMVRESLAREAAILTFLKGKKLKSVIRLRSAKLQRPDPFVCLDWHEGETAFGVLQAWNRPLVERAAIVLSMLDAYRQLHACGILHGDVHPSNILVLSNRQVRLIDFGGACHRRSKRTFERIGLTPFYEPEAATAVLSGQGLPPPTSRGEQYAVASLAFSLLAGVTCIDLAFPTESVLNDIAFTQPRLLSSVGLQWPTVERILDRALSKNPDKRYGSLAYFSRSLSSAIRLALRGFERTSKIKTRAPLDYSPPAVLIKSLITRPFGLDSPLIRSGLLRGPRASVYRGGAGIAYALFRTAILYGHSRYLAAADVWISRALADAGSRAFQSEFQTKHETCELSLFHGRPGLYVVRALVSHAGGDEHGLIAAIEAYLALTTAPRKPQNLRRWRPFLSDTTNGPASVLLGLAILWPLCQGMAKLSLRLDGLANQFARLVRDNLADTGNASFLMGLAHGRAGNILSLLRWKEASGEDATARSDLAEMLAVSSCSERARQWPVDSSARSKPGWTGWCHGSAGHVLMWLVSYRVNKRPADLRVAEEAAHHMWKFRGNSGASLCCGSAGEALSMFALSHATGENVWRARGHRLLSSARRNIASLEQEQGLFRGSVGIGLATLEAQARVPAWPFCS
jgi:serine/threonine protein kinase